MSAVRTFRRPRLALTLGLLAAVAVALGTDRVHAGAGTQGEEKQAFEAAKELGTVEAWDAFLSNYPSGFHADLARAYVKKLAAPSASPAAAPQPPALSAPAAAPLPPAAPAPGAIEQLALEQPCPYARSIRSRESREPVKIRFINQSGATRIIQWIDFDGALKEYATLAPGAELTQDTYMTHPWIAAYEEGSCRQLFLPSAGMSIALLTPERQERDSAAPGGTTSNTSSSRSKSTSSKGGSENAARKKSADKPSKKSIERRAKAACEEIGMILLNGQCAPKKASERAKAAKNKNKPCPPGMYRNPYGNCQPNETGG